MVRSDLCFFRIFPKTVHPVVLYVIMLYYMLLSIVERLVVVVDVEQGWYKYTTLWHAILLLSPSAAFVVFFHIESSVGQQVLNDSTKFVVLCSVVEFCIRSIWSTVSYAADRSTKTVPVIFPSW